MRVCSQVPVGEGVCISRLPRRGGMPLLWGAIGEPIGEPIAGRAMPPGGAMPGEAPMPTPPLVCGAAP